MSYSQGEEEAVILQHLGGWPSGRLLDLGAFDGKTFSNSLALIERGWEAVLVEASALPFHALSQRFAQNEKVTMVQGIVVVDTPSPNLIPFYQCDDAVSSTSKAHRDLWGGHIKDPFIKVMQPVFSLADLIRVVGSDFALVSIDTEGSSVDLLKEAVRLGVSPNVFIIEHDKRQEEVYEILRDYQQFYFSGENVVMVRT